MKLLFVLLLLVSAFLLNTAVCTAEASALEHPEKKSYSVKKAGGKIIWDSLPVLSIDNVLWSEDTGIRAWGQLCHDNRALFVHLRVAEKNIRAELTEPLSPVCEDSCLEFFFMLPDKDNYFNFEINPNGCLRVQFGPSRADRLDLVRKNATDYFSIRTNRTADGWEVFYRIPLQFIRLFYPEYRFEGKLLGNMYKCGDRTAVEHYLSWSRIDLDTPDFHQPGFFGLLTFDG